MEYETEAFICATAPTSDEAVQIRRDMIEQGVCDKSAWVEERGNKWVVYERIASGKELE